MYAHGQTGSKWKLRSACFTRCPLWLFALDFAQIDPKHPPTLVSISGDADWSILFIGGGAAIELKRSDLRRVKPYGERFEVKIGTLKAIDF